MFLKRRHRAGFRKIRVDGKEYQYRPSWNKLIVYNENGFKQEIPLTQNYHEENVFLPSDAANAIKVFNAFGKEQQFVRITIPQKPKQPVLKDIHFQD